MGKRKSLTNAEKERVMRFLGAGENTLIIAKKLKRDKRTVDKFVQNSSERRRRSDKSKFRIIGRRQLMNLKRVASQLKYFLKLALMFCRNHPDVVSYEKLQQ